MAEYGRVQRNRLSRAIANSETKSRQLKEIADKRVNHNNWSHPEVNYTIVTQCMNRNLPPRPLGLTKEAWNKYVREFNNRTHTVNDLNDPRNNPINDAKKHLAVGDFLFHGTTKRALRSILANGLLPRDPVILGSYSSTKDGYLSFSKTPSNANGMGGTGRQPRLRIRLQMADLVDDPVVNPGDHISPFKVQQSTGEMLTTRTFPANRLRCAWTSGVGSGNYILLSNFIEQNNNEIP